MDAFVTLAASSIWSGIAVVQLLAFCRQPRLVLLSGLKDREEPAWVLAAIGATVGGAFWLQTDDRCSAVLTLPPDIPLGVQLLGLAVGLAALVLFAAVHWSLGLSWNPTVATQGEAQKLVTSGPYAVVRHPLYTSVLLMAVFALLATGWVLVSLAFTTGFAFFVVARVPAEDRMMERQFGDEWRMWRAGTGAVLPGELERLFLRGLSGRAPPPHTTLPGAAEGGGGDGDGAGAAVVGGAAGVVTQGEKTSLLS